MQKNLIHKFGWPRIISYAATIIISFFYVILPDLYLVTYSPPSDKELFSSEGVIRAHKKRGRGEYLSVKTKNDVIYLECRRTIFSKMSCDFQGKLGKALEKKATVFWDERAIYPFTTQKQFLGAIMDGEIISSMGRERRLIEKSKISSAWISIIFAVLIALLITYDARKHLRSK